MAQQTYDILAVDHGTLVLFYPLNEDSKAWFEDHVETPSVTMGRGIPCEHRYADALIEGIDDAGFTMNFQLGH